MPHFSDAATRCFLFALKEATQLGHASVNPEHLLLGIVHADAHLAYQFKRIGLSEVYLREQIEHKIEGSQTTDLASYSDALRRLVASLARADTVTPEHLLQAIILQRPKLAYELLERTGKLDTLLT